MRAPCLLMSLLVGCAIQGQITAEMNDTCFVEPASESTFASSVVLRPKELPALAVEADQLPVKVLQATPMEGPYTSIEEYCEWLFRTSERFNPVSENNTCSYSLFQRRKGSIHGAQVLYASFSSPEGATGGEYHLALQTEAGWFVSDAQYLDEISESAARSLYETRVFRERLWIEDMIPGGELEVMLRATKKVARFCDGCEAEAKHREVPLLSTQEQLIICGINHTQPSCVAFGSPHSEQGIATKLSLSFGTDGVANASTKTMAFSVSKENWFKGQLRIDFL
jgi:hypothetical protein